MGEKSFKDILNDIVEDNHKFLAVVLASFYLIELIFVWIDGEYSTRFKILISILITILYIVLYKFILIIDTWDIMKRKRGEVDEEVTRDF